MLEKAKFIKAIFFDVDGTLYDHTIHDFPSSTKAVLHLLGDQGYQLFVATSRSEQELIHVWELIDQHPFIGVISSGGAMTRINNDVVDIQYMDSLEVETIMAFCREQKIDVRWQSVDACYFDFEPAQKSKDVFDYLYQMVPGVRTWKGEKLINLLCYVTEEQARILETKIKESSIVHYGGAIELTGKGVNKASAVKRLVASRNLTMEEVAAFGDGENDERMLKEVGIGIAMGNGSSITKNAADLVTSDIRDDGLAYACRLLGFVDEGTVV